jgi:hypothetical protein
MAKRYIGKGSLSADGQSRQLIMHIQDADGRFREEPMGEVPEVDCDAAIERYVESGQVHGVWNPLST